MKISFDNSLSVRYKSAPQRIRVLTEGWVDNEVFCPACGRDIKQCENNRPVADFLCLNCKEEYELKSKKGGIGNKIVDGAYRTMIERLQSNNNPNLFLLNYNLKSLEVYNFLVIPKHFFVPQIIEKRKALSRLARRAGWIGCNIVLQNIPNSGKIFYVKSGKIEDRKTILKNWSNTLFLRKEEEPKAKSWILDIMNCIDRLNKKEFLLSEIYGFEKALSLKHPGNRYIKDKIRQQLQFLRDKGYLEFVGRGKYSLIQSNER